MDNLRFLFCLLFVLFITSFQVFAQEQTTETTTESVLYIEVSADDPCPSDYLELNEDTLECDCIDGYVTARDDTTGAITCSRSTAEETTESVAVDISAGTVTTITTTTPGSFNAEAAGGAGCSLFSMAGVAPSVVPTLIFLLSTGGFLFFRRFQAK